MPTQIATRRKYGSNSDKEMVIHDTEYPTPEARLAMALIEKWGIVAGVPDGEDSAGRSKLGLMPVGDLVGRACDTATSAFSKFRELGWLMPTPDIGEIIGKPDDDK